MADSYWRPWTLDVSSLIVLISEEEERNYRLSRRSLIQCLAMVPVVGLQNYVRTYDFLLESSAYTYFSPYGVKSAPLRNAPLSNAIKHNGLLEDGKYTVFEVPTDAASIKRNRRSNSRYQIALCSWIVITWVFFAGLLVAMILVPKTTWVSIVTCTIFTVWSVVLRLVEYCNVVSAPTSTNNITNPDRPDAAFVLGRSNSAFVLQGRRQDIKDWTSRGLIYRRRPWGIPSQVWQGFTRLGSLLVLLLIFTTIPNGSTVDQVAFVLLNSVAQLNVLLGQRLNGYCFLSRLSKMEESREKTRTHIYGKLLRRFKKAEESRHWVEVSGLLPKTEVWDKWREEVTLDDDIDAKELYNEISGELALKQEGGISTVTTASIP